MVAVERLAALLQASGISAVHLGVRAAGLEIAAQARGALRSGGSTGRHPYRRVGPLHRLRLDLRVVDGEAAAVEVDPFLGPRPPHDLDAFLDARRTLVLRDAEDFKLLQPVPDPDAHVEPPAEQLVQDGHLLGDEQRVVEGQDLDGGADAYALGAHGERAGEGGE